MSYLVSGETFPKRTRGGDTYYYYSIPVLLSPETKGDIIVIRGRQSRTKLV